MSATKKILIITGDGGESFETWFAVQRFQEAGYEAVVAAPSKRRLHLVMHDFEPGWDTYREAPGYAIEADVTFDQVTVNDYAGVVCIGGRAPEYLRLNEKVIEVVRHFFDEDKPVAAICHGPQILCTAGVIQGRTVSAYPAVTPDLKLAGARVADVPIDGAHTDGNLVTAPAWPAHPAFIAQFLKVLGTRIEHEEMAGAVA